MKQWRRAQDIHPQQSVARYLCLYPQAPGEAGDDADDDELGAAGGYLHGNSSLRQGVGAVMEAMRELLQTLEPLQARDGDDDHPPDDHQLEELDWTL